MSIVHMDFKAKLHVVLRHLALGFGDLSYYVVYLSLFYY